MTQQLDTALFKVGDKVRLVADPSSVGVIVRGPESRRNTFHYQVFFNSQKGEMLFAENALEIQEKQNDFTTACECGEFLDRTEFLQFLILEKIRQPLSDNLYTFYASRTDFQVHQFKPVLKFIPSVDQRLFLADEGWTRQDYRSWHHPDRASGQASGTLARVDRLSRGTARKVGNRNETAFRRSV